jgi:Flp pilus assembly protein TadD
MPPWLPAPGSPVFVGERRLPAHQIDTIQRWVSHGVIEGNAADLPPPPHLSSEWQLGQPDLVLTMPRPYNHLPGSHDVFRNVVLHSSLGAARLVRAVEFRAGRAPIHHAIIRIDRTRESRALDGADGEPGFDGMAALSVQNPEGHFIGWAPGRGPITSPEGMPWRLDPGSDLVIELHLLHVEAPVAVQPSVGLYFTDKPQADSPVMVVMGTKAIDIPAGERDYSITDTCVIPVDVKLLSLYPHAHYLGKAMSVRATLPDGRTQALLQIDRWDFHWQQDYRYASPVVLPRGTKITMRYTYDNSEDNPANPHHPPSAVTWGPQSSDEMANLGLQFVPLSRPDAPILANFFAQREVLDNVRGAEIRVRHAPDDPHERTWLGSSYLEAGRIPEAIQHLQIAVRLDARSAQAHNFLGGALLAAGRTTEALTHLRLAATLAPGDAHLQFNVGKALATAGRAAEAAQRFERAIGMDETFAEAHQELGALLFSHGRVRESLPHLQRAVDLSPESAEAHSDLGGALAEAGRFDEAEAHLRRALELNPDYGPARQNLSRLPSRVGR